MEKSKNKNEENKHKEKSQKRPKKQKQRSQRNCTAALSTAAQGSPPGHTPGEVAQEPTTGWFKLHDGNLFPGQSPRRFFESDPEILKTSFMSHYQDLTNLSYS